MNTKNIERALLATFLWSNDLWICTKDAFIMDTSIFTSQDRKLIASKINEVTKTEDRFYSLLNMEVENTCQHEWLNISGYTPFEFSLAKKYYDKLLSDYTNKLRTY